MAALAWVMMAIAIWHFTVFLPDRFWAGIVGAFLFAVLGSLAFGFAIHAGDLPSRDDTTIVTALEAIPGTLLGLGLCWWIGMRQEARSGPRGDAFGRAA